MDDKIDENLIPVERLQHGFESCLILTELLLESSEVLLKSNNYPTSIALSILALEESAKLELLHKKIMISEAIKEKEWKKITNDSEAHIKKLVRPVMEEHSSMKSIDKESYEKMQEIRSDLGLADIPSFDDLTSIDDSQFDYYRILNKIKQDCIYLDWNVSDWFSFFYLPIEKQQAYANSRLIFTKQIILDLAMRNRLFQLSFKSENKKLENEIVVYRNEISEINKIIKSKKFEEYQNLTKDLLKQYASLRLRRYNVVDRDEKEITFTLDDIHELPDIFFELYIGTGILPEKILTLRKNDIDLDKNTIASDFDGCEVCHKQKESDLTKWENHFLTNEHFGIVYAYFKSKFKLKDSDPALIKLKNIISARRSK